MKENFLKHHKDVLKNINLTTTEKCKIMEKILLKEQGNDPLKAWIQYYNWLNSKNDVPSKVIINVMEKCTINFRKDERYRQDPRYLHLWIEYVRDFTTSNLKIFHHHHHAKTINFSYIPIIIITFNFHNYVNNNNNN
jgi:hypothetical protein